MGVKKSLNTKRDAYHMLKAAELAAEMIGAYERRRHGACVLRIEAIDVKGWDDIHVIEDALEHWWQVKRQQTPWKESDAKAYFQTAAQLRPNTNYHLGLTAFVDVTDGTNVVFSTRQLADLCNSARERGLDLKQFKRMHRSNAALRYLSNFIDDSLLLEFLERLHVVELGLEDRIRREAVAHLNDFFENSDDVIRHLHHWLWDHSNGAVSHTIPLLYENVLTKHGRRAQARPPWLEFGIEAGQQTWSAHGSIALADLATQLRHTPGNLSLRLAAQPLPKRSVATLIRLSIQYKDRIRSEASNPTDWVAIAKHMCGGTLGTNATGLPNPFSELGGPCAHAPRERILDRQLVERLGNLLDENTWLLFSDRVDLCLTETEIEPALEKVMRDIWETWSTQLRSAPKLRTALFLSMVTTAEERSRRGFDSSIRLGPLMVDNLARATVALLAIAATLTSKGLTVELSEATATCLQVSSIPIHLLALTSASTAQEQSPRAIAERPDAILQSETGIVILGAVQASAEVLRDVATMEDHPYHLDSDAPSSLHRTDMLCALLAACPLLLKAMRQGTAAMSQHLSNLLANAWLDGPTIDPSETSAV